VAALSWLPGMVEEGESDERSPVENLLKKCLRVKVKRS